MNDKDFEYEYINCTDDSTQKGVLESFIELFDGDSHDYKRASIVKWNDCTGKLVIPQNDIVNNTLHFFLKDV